MQFQGITWNIEELPAISRNCRTFQGITWDFKEVHGVSSNCMEKKFKELYAISKISMDFQGTVNNFR